MKTLPLATLLVCITAAIPAPLVARFFGWLLDIHWEQIYRKPEMLTAYACFGAACEALGMYLLGVLPLEYFRPRLRTYPRGVSYAAAFVGAVLGASAGNLLAFSRVRDLLGGAKVLRAQPPMGRIIALSVMMTLTAAFLITIVRTLIAEAENREHVLAEAAALAKAHALQAQINPHFFFNTLTTISALAELDSRAAKELVGQLAELFRYTLSCSHFELVSVAQELQFVSNYLLIEKARFRRRLQLEIPPQGTGADVFLPGLTLQPLVENAIRYGIAKRRQGGTIKIEFKRSTVEGPRSDSEAGWVLSVANQIAPEEGVLFLEEGQAFRPGHSLANTRDRLSLAFGNRARLDFHIDGGEWVIVVLTLPAARGIA